MRKKRKRRLTKQAVLTAGNRLVGTSLAAQDVETALYEFQAHAHLRRGLTNKQYRLQRLSAASHLARTLEKYRKTVEKTEDYLVKVERQIVHSLTDAISDIIWD